MSERIVLEGACGVGKTTLGKALSARLGAPLYRPFRGSSLRIAESTVMAMQELGINVNDWQEDLYVADVMANIPGFSVVLDRSMPSALAWQQRRHRVISPARELNGVLRLWGERIVASGAILVLVECEERLRAMRSPDRGGSWERDAIIAMLMRALYHQPTMKIWRVNTDTLQADELADAIANAARVGELSTHIEVING